MNALQKALDAINTMSVSSGSSTIDPRMRLIVSLVYIGIVLSVPMLDPARLIWMFIYPIVAAEASGIGYGRVFLRSLWVLPLIMLIGAFNPLFDHQTCFEIEHVAISCGWVSFISIILRGLLTFQALVILVMSMGFYDMIKALGAVGCPAVLTTQLMMVYRYIGVLLLEAMTMHRARESRGFGRRSYPLKMWGIFVGQLLVRSLHRSRRIDAAMAARGFNGIYRWSKELDKPAWASWAWMLAWCGVFAALRFVDLTSIFNDFIVNHIN